MQVVATYWLTIGSHLVKLLKSCFCPAVVLLLSDPPLVFRFLHQHLVHSVKMHLIAVHEVAESTYVLEEPSHDTLEHLVLAHVVCQVLWVAYLKFTLVFQRCWALLSL